MPLAMWQWQPWTALAGILGIAAVSVLLVRSPAPRPVGKAAAPVGIARLTNLHHARWIHDDEALSVGQRLLPGMLRLAEGIAKISFDEGCEMIVEAPAELELIGPTQAFLHEGRAFATVTEPGKQFTVDTPAATVLDLGTTFGVAAERTGSTVVQVFSGAVLAESKRDGEQHELKAGDALRIEREGDKPSLAMVFSPERFVSSVPDPTSPEYEQGHPYNRRQHDCVHIVPAPGEIAVDGDLSDWDQSGKFRSACDEPYSAAHYVEGLMMYDADYLYVGAHVGDPAPMRSILNPADEEKDCLCWRGGSVQVRVSTSTDLDWPLEGEMPWPNMTQHGNRPCDISDNIIHMTFWYYAPEQLPSLHIEYGMDMHGDRVNPAGYRGAFRRDSDGRGYVFEYAVPWRLLSAEAKPPRGGDVLAACWNVHWSDNGGRRWKGHLVDVLNPDARGETYVWGKTWGRAIYHAEGDLPPGVVAPTP
jgi:hypothetical protein